MTRDPSRPTRRAAVARPSLCLAPLLVLLASAVPAVAADNNGAFAIDGIGLRSCADFTRALDDRNRDQIIAFSSWTDGFVSGSNVFAQDTYDLTPWQASELIQAKLAKYCRENPDDAYVTAAGKLVGALQPQRMTVAEKLVSVRVGDRGIYIYPGVLTRVRARLIAEGIDVPTPEGSFDDAFAKALQSYQKKAGLPESGLPDLPTMNALFP